MAFADNQQRSRTTAIAAVAIIHVAIGYAFVTGLAQNAITQIPKIFVVRSFRAAPPPKADPVRKEMPKATARPVTTVAPVIPTQLTATDNRLVVDTKILPDTGAAQDNAEQPITPPPVMPSKAQKPAPATDRGGWITTDDYPATAIRAEAQGAVGITVAIDERGRVMACTVTASSGNDALDAATCRLYPRRARFTPALDDAGRPVPTTYNDRVRWQLPQ